MDVNQFMVASVISFVIIAYVGTFGFRSKKESK